MLVTRCNVVERLGMLVEGGVEEAKGTLLAGLDTLIDDAIDQGGKDWGRLGSATASSLLATVKDNTIKSISSDVGVATTTSVVNTSGRNGTIGLVVRLVSRIMLRKVTKRRSC